MFVVILLDVIGTQMFPPRQPDYFHSAVASFFSGNTVAIRYNDHDNLNVNKIHPDLDQILICSPLITKKLV